MLQTDAESAVTHTVIVSYYHNFRDNLTNNGQINLGAHLEIYSAECAPNTR